MVELLHDDFGDVAYTYRNRFLLSYYVCVWRTEDSLANVLATRAIRFDLDYPLMSVDLKAAEVTALNSYQLAVIGLFFVRAIGHFIGQKGAEERFDC